jgi:hypothetical protein
MDIGAVDRAAGRVVYFADMSACAYYYRWSFGVTGSVPVEFGVA